jgi:hypothetical protein
MLPGTRRSDRRDHADTLGRYVMSGCVVVDDTHSDGRLRNGMCGAHYYRSRHGMPMKITKTSRNTSATFLKRFDRSAGPNACHPWTGYTSKDGYGRVHYQGRLWSTHVLAFVLAGGIIPDGYEVGHTCHDADKSCTMGDQCPHRPCGNPRHLKAMTHEENCQSGRQGDKRL